MKSGEHITIPNEEARPATAFERETVKAIGAILVELRQQREAAIELARAAAALLAQQNAARDAASAEAIGQINSRITQALKKLRAAGTE